MRIVSVVLLATAAFSTSAEARPLHLSLPFMSSNQHATEYGALADVLMQSGDHSPVVDQLVQTVVIRLASDHPVLAKAEVTFPGVSASLGELLRPVLAQRQQRLADQARPQMTTLLRSGMSPAEARAITAFYRSPLGDKVMREVVAQSAPATDDARQKRKLANEPDGVSLTPAERAQIDRFFVSGAGRRLSPLLPRLMRLRTNLERQSITPQESHAILAIVKKATDAYQLLTRAPAPNEPTKPIARHTFIS